MSIAQPTLDDVWQLFRETAIQQKEIATRQQESDRQFQEYKREAERRSQEIDKRFQETDKKIDRIATQLGDIGNRVGEFVEEQVMPSALKLLQERGIAVHEMHRRVNAKRSGKSTEIDLLLVNDTEIVVVEVKSCLSIEHVDKHLQRLDKFKFLFPHYAQLRVYGAVAGMVVLNESKDYALNQGLFVFIPAANIMQLANDATFVPRAW